MTAKWIESIPAPRARGTALVLVTLVIIILAGVAVSMSIVSVANTATTDNARDRQQALLMAQAGFSAAIRQLNKALTEDLPDNQTVAASWGPSQRYSTTISKNADGTYTILSTGVVTNTASVGTGLTVQRQLSGIVDAPTSAGLFPAGAFGKDFVQLSGVAVIDSYSYSLSYTYLQQVLAAGGKALFQAIIGNKGNIGSNGPIKGDGAIIVYGNATPGPNSAVSFSGLLGTGLLSTVTGSTAPAATAMPIDSFVYDPPIPAAGAYNLSLLSFATMSTGTYRYTSFNQSGGTLTVNGKVNLYIDGDVTQSGLGLIVLTPNASLTIYQGANGKYDLNGLGLHNLDLNPSTYNLVTASTKTVTVTAIGDTFVTVYAPDAAVTLKGAGELYGGVIGKSVTLNGLGLFHWDRLARSPGIKRPLNVVACWEVDI